MCTKLCCIDSNKIEAKQRGKRKKKAKIIRSFLGSWSNANSVMDIRRDRQASVNQRWRVTGALWDHQAVFQAIGFVQVCKGNKIKFTWQTLLLDGQIIKLKLARVLIIDPPEVIGNKLTFDLPILRVAMTPSLIRELKFIFPSECNFFVDNQPI
jgi:hypothetical protein